MCVCMKGEGMGHLVNTNNFLLSSVKGYNRISNVGRDRLCGEE